MAMQSKFPASSKPMTKYAVLLLVLLLIIFLFFSFKNKYKKTTVKINGVKLQVEIADSPAKRTKGLMFRKNLPKDGGMLFVFVNEAKHSFWMANTFIPLDIVWINSNKEVVYIKKEVPPCTENIKSACKIYKPNTNAKYVLELNSGKSSDLNIQVGNTINFDL